VDADLAHVEGLLSVDLYGADVKLVSAAGFRVLSEAKFVDVSHVSTLRPAAFPSFKKVENLRMAWCRQKTLSDAIFSNLHSIRELDMTLCWQESFTDDGLRLLMKHGTLKRLNIGGCSQKTTTDAGVSDVLDAGIEVLDVSGCRQLSDAVFSSTINRFLNGEKVALQRVDVSFCPLITSESILHLTDYGVAVEKRISEREGRGAVLEA